MTTYCPRCLLVDHRSRENWDHTCTPHPAAEELERLKDCCNRFSEDEILLAHHTRIDELERELERLRDLGSEQFKIEARLREALELILQGKSNYDIGPQIVLNEVHRIARAALEQK